MFGHSMSVTCNLRRSSKIWTAENQRGQLDTEHQTMAMEDGNSTATKLITLLNVSATKAGKRKRLHDALESSSKLNKRKSVRLTVDSEESTPSPPEGETEATVALDADIEASIPDANDLLEDDDERE